MSRRPRSTDKRSLDLARVPDKIIDAVTYIPEDVRMAFFRAPDVEVLCAYFQSTDRLKIKAMQFSRSTHEIIP